MPAIDRLRDRFDLRRLVMVGDRGMISSEAIEALRDEPGVGWISALKSASIRSLIKQGHLQLDLFDERNLFEFARWTSVTPPFASGVTPRASPPRPRSTGFTSSAPRSHPMTWTPPSACDDTSPLAQPVFHRVFHGYLLILRLESQTLASEMAVARVGTGDFTLELAWSGRDPP